MTNIYFFPSKPHRRFRRASSGSRATILLLLLDLNSKFRETQSGVPYRNGGGWRSRVLSIMKNLDGTATPPPPSPRHSNSSLARNYTTKNRRLPLRARTE
jgi:hypothetical protein